MEHCSYPHIYVLEEPRKLKTSRVLTDGIKVNGGDLIGRIGVMAEMLPPTNGQFTSYIRNLDEEIRKALKMLSLECQNGRFGRAVAFGDISRLAKLAGRYGFSVFKDFDPEDVEMAQFYGETTGRIGANVGGRYDIWKNWQSQGISTSDAYEALISRNALLQMA